MTPGSFGPSIISARDIADYLRNILGEQSGNPLQVTSDFLLGLRHSVERIRFKSILFFCFHWEKEL